jgi:general secretion pathway protein B
MSYILDALKRADAERERGHVPGLHARQIAAPPTPSGQGVRRLVAVAGLSVLVLGGAVVLWLSRAPDGDAEVAKTASTKSAPGTLAGDAVAPRTVVATATRIEVTPPQTAAPAPLADSNLANVSAAKPAVDSPVVPAKVSAVPVASIDGKGKTPVAVSAPTQAAIPLLSELPEDTRRQIPALAITGAVYSELPGQRMLLVNAQVLKQGSPAGADLTLEEIHAASSVFNFRGIRFRVRH